MLVGRNDRAFLIELDQLFNSLQIHPSVMLAGFFSWASDETSSELRKIGLFRASSESLISFSDLRLFGNGLFEHRVLLQLLLTRALSSKVGAWSSASDCCNCGARTQRLCQLAISVGLVPCAAL